jgi:hypothetical protein
MERQKYLEKSGLAFDFQVRESLDLFCAEHRLAAKSVDLAQLVVLQTQPYTPE